MKYEVKFTSQFKRDLKLAKKQERYCSDWKEIFKVSSNDTHSFS